MVTDHVALVAEALSKSGRCESKLTPEVLAVPGFTSAKVKHLLNILGERCSNYLEIGSLHGATLTAACFGNRIEAVAIDNFSQFGGQEFTLKQNIERFCPRCRFLNQDAFSPAVLAQFDRPVDLYFYDGNHSMEAQETALTHFESVLAKEVIYVCDDWNWPDVRAGTGQALRKIGYAPIYQNEIFSSGDADAAGYWNGLGIFILKRNQ